MTMKRSLSAGLAGIVAVSAQLAFRPAAWAASSALYANWAVPVPGSFLLENYGSFTNAGTSNSVGNLIYLAYFTKTGFTGTARDSLEFWSGISLGYQNPNGGHTSANGFGFSVPNLGGEYYNHLVTSSLTPGDAGYRSWWGGPWGEINAPNGDNKQAGYGAGQNRFSIDAGLFRNSAQWGKLLLSTDPLVFHYAFRDQTASPYLTSTGTMSQRRAQGGLSLDAGIFTLSYPVSKNWTLGVTHDASFYAIADTQAHESFEAIIGPSVSWSGLSKYGIALAASLTTDYVHTTNLKQSTYATLWAGWFF